MSCIMELHQIIFGLGHVGVVRSQFGLVDHQGSQVVVLHLVVLALVLAQQGQVVQLLGDVRVILPQHLHKNVAFAFKHFVVCAQSQTYIYFTRRVE